VQGCFCKTPEKRLFDQRHRRILAVDPLMDGWRGRGLALWTWSTGARCTSYIRAERYAISSVPAGSGSCGRTYAARGGGAAADGGARQWLRRRFVGVARTKVSGHGLGRDLVLRGAGVTEELSRCPGRRLGRQVRASWPVANGRPRHTTTTTMLLAPGARKRD
jgi:hypothetical protein